MSNEDMIEQGFARSTLRVVRFHDAFTDMPWFYRDVEEIGTVETWVDGGTPCDAKELHSFVAEHFGPEAHVLY